MISQKLFMLLLGCKPPGRNTEQHDIFFSIGEKLSDLIPAIKRSWPEAKGGIHLDAWREVSRVEGYSIQIVKKEAKQSKNEAAQKLFFINLGGYKQNEFEEFHYKMVAVAPDKGDAVKQSKRTAFYKHTGIKSAPSHVDDRYGIDVDDIYGIEEILSDELKRQYAIEIMPATDTTEDEIHLGYFTMEKIRFMDLNASPNSFYT